MATGFLHRCTRHFDRSTDESWYGYRCGHCDSRGPGAVIADTCDPRGKTLVRWLMCLKCGKGSVALEDGSVIPGIPFRPRIDGLPDTVEAGYEEARRCIAANCLTAGETMCRKILMHVAVEKVAKEGDSF